MIKKSLFVLIIIIIFVSCSNKKTEKPQNIIKNKIDNKEKLKIKNMVLLNKIPSYNSKLTMGLYKNKIYYIKWKNQKLLLYFYNLKKKKNKHFVFHKGKGPGKVLNISQVLVKNSKIYLYDNKQKRIEIYNYNEKNVNYEDTIMLDENLGFGGVIDVFNNKLYYHGLINTKIAKINLKSSKVIKRKKYKKPGFLDFKKKIKKLLKLDLKKAVIYVDEKMKRVLIGYWNKPYKIEVYDYKLNYLYKVKKELEYEYEKYKISTSGIGGNKLISSIIGYKNKYFVSGGGGEKIKFSDEGEIKGLDSHVKIGIYNKNNLNLEKEVFISKFENIKGSFILLGGNKKNLFFLGKIYGDEKNNILQKYFDLEDITKKKKSFILLTENPINL